MMTREVPTTSSLPRDLFPYEDPDILNSLDEEDDYEDDEDDWDDDYEDEEDDYEDDEDDLDDDDLD